MITKPVFLAAISAAFLTACGGGSDSTTSSGETITATKGVFVMGSAANFFFSAEPYWQVVLEGGETWIVKEFNARGEPIFFATGNFRFTDQVVTTRSGSLTTTTTTTTPERTATETSIVPTVLSSVESFRSNTNFKSDNALIAINSNISGISEVTYSETAQLNAPGASFVAVATPSVGAPTIPGSKRGLDPDSPFAYDRSAETQRLAGTYQFAFNRTNSNMVVSSNGGFNGTNQVTGCSFTGTFTPHPNGKNVFISSLTVTNCQDAGSYRGIAAPYPRPDVQTGNGSQPDLITESGEIVPAVFIAAVNSSNSRVFSVAMFRDAR